ncbi:MAG: hypothetical protein J6Y85_03900, partial [Alphaproteobacteria bacterium]|nr:hypothetical protein [Alphaproteobacteria bacterium]
PKKCSTSTRCMLVRETIGNSGHTWWFDDQPVDSDTCKAYQASSSALGSDTLPSGASRKDQLTALCGPLNKITKPCECYDGSCEASCLPKNGMCSYDLTQSPTRLEADCHYKFRNQVEALAADCHYQITDSVVSGNVHSISLNKVTGCKGDKYCYLYYSKSDCSSTAGASIGSTKTDDIYGVCINKDQVNTQCSINIVTPPSLRKIQGCTGDQYCYLYYAQETCSSAAAAGIGASQEDDIYGVCINKDQVNTQCSIKGGEMTLSKNLGCPIGKYCYLNWQSQSCSDTAGASYLGTFWGSCIPNSTNSYSCPFTAAN